MFSRTTVGERMLANKEVHHERDVGRAEVGPQALVAWRQGAKSSEALCPWVSRVNGLCKSELPHRRLTKGHLVDPAHADSTTHPHPPTVLPFQPLHAPLTVSSIEIPSVTDCFFSRDDCTGH